MLQGRFLNIGVLFSPHYFGQPDAAAILKSSDFSAKLLQFTKQGLIAILKLRLVIEVVKMFAIVGISETTRRQIPDHAQFQFVFLSFAGNAGKATEQAVLAEVPYIRDIPILHERLLPTERI
jgi:hypothetical protein